MNAYQLHIFNYYFIALLFYEFSELLFFILLNLIHRIFFMFLPQNQFFTNLLSVFFLTKRVFAKTNKKKLYDFLLSFFVWVLLLFCYDLTFVVVVCKYYQLFKFNTLVAGGKLTIKQVCYFLHKIKCWHSVIKCHNAIP